MEWQGFRNVSGNSKLYKNAFELPLYKKAEITPRMFLSP